MKLNKFHRLNNVKKFKLIKLNHKNPLSGQIFNYNKHFNILIRYKQLELSKWKLIQGFRHQKNKVNH